MAELQLADYRNYRQLQLSLQPGAHLFFGENGEGKTNLVEAVGFLANLESHRASQQKSLVFTGSPTATISAKVSHGDRQILLAAEINTESPNRYFINGNKQKRSSDLIGNLAAVIFAPEDLDIVRRDPGDRRAFLDNSMAQLRPRLASVKLDYDRVLKQRNALLKSARGVPNPDLGTLDIWDEQLISLGQQITLARLDLISQIRPLIENFYKSLAASDEEISLHLVSVGDDDQEEGIDADQISDQLRERLQQLRQRELERGITLVGPHRDELVIQKSGLLARTHASQGEAWSIALGLKLAMAQLLRERPGGDPVVILDDVFAVLDPGRRKRLIEFVGGFEQVLVTAADRASTPELAWSQVHEVSGGEIR